jgi:hypothetical protein
MLFRLWISFRFFCGVKLFFQNGIAGFSKSVPMRFLARSAISGIKQTAPQLTRNAAEP